MTKPLTAQDLADTFDAFNRHDVDGVMTHFADDCVFYTVGAHILRIPAAVDCLVLVTHLACQLWYKGDFACALGPMTPSRIGLEQISTYCQIS